MCSGAPQAVFPIPFENCDSKNRVLAVVDSTQKLHLYPSCKTVAANFSAIASDFAFTTLTRDLESTSLMGWSPSATSSEATFDTTQLWSMPFAEGVTSVSPVEMDVIASYGRPLGNKSTLYKYLNPHLVVATTSSAVYVVDSVTGSVAHTARVDGTSLRAAMVENWLVYAWLSPRGWRLASVELYEHVRGKGVTYVAAIRQSRLTSQTWTIEFCSPKRLGRTEDIHRAIRNHRSWVLRLPIRHHCKRAHLWV